MLKCGLQFLFGFHHIWRANLCIMGEDLRVTCSANVLWLIYMVEISGRYKCDKSRKVAMLLKIRITSNHYCYQVGTSLHRSLSHEHLITVKCRTSADFSIRPMATVWLMFWHVWPLIPIITSPSTIPAFCALLFGRS